MDAPSGGSGPDPWTELGSARGTISGAGGAVRPVTRDDLAPFAHDAEHLDRLLADVDLAARLRARDYSGPEWEFVATKAFAGYGYAVLCGWMRTQQIWDKVTERCRGIRLERPPLSAPWVPEAWDTIATDALAEAIPSFRDTVLRRGRWDPKRKATMRTFFIGHCLWRVPNAYRRWLTSVAHHAHEQLHDDDTWEYVLDGSDREVAARHAIGEQLDAELDRLDPRTARVLELTTAGYDQTQIAERLETTRKSIEMIMRRHRERQQARQHARQRLEQRRPEGHHDSA